MSATATPGPRAQVDGFSAPRAPRVVLSNQFQGESRGADLMNQGKKQV